MISHLPAVTIFLWVYSFGLHYWAVSEERVLPKYLEKLWVGDVHADYGRASWGNKAISDGRVFCILDCDRDDPIGADESRKGRVSLKPYAPLHLTVPGSPQCNKLMLWHADSKLALGKGWAYFRRPYKSSVSRTYTQPCHWDINLMWEFKNCIRDHGGEGQRFWDTGQCDHLAHAFLDPCGDRFECERDPKCDLTHAPTTAAPTHEITTMWPDSMANENTVVSGHLTIDECTSLWQNILNQSSSPSYDNFTFGRGTTLSPYSVTNLTTTLSGDSTIGGDTTLFRDLLANLTSPASVGSNIKGGATLPGDAIFGDGTIDNEQDHYQALYSSSNRGLNSWRNRTALGGLLTFLAAVACICVYVYRRRQVRNKPFKWEYAYNPVIGTEPSDQSTGAVEKTKSTIATPV